MVPFGRGAIGGARQLGERHGRRRGGVRHFGACAAALRTLSRIAEGGAEDGRALEGCSLAQPAQLLHGAHFLDVDVELRRLLSRSLCTGHLAGKSGPELGRLLGVEGDFPSEAERQAATEEPIFTHDAQHDVPAPGEADTPTPPAPYQRLCAGSRRSS